RGSERSRQGECGSTTKTDEQKGELKMPTAVAEDVSNKTRAYAENIRKQLQELGGDFALKGWRIGLLVVEVQDKNVWEILGYETETAFRNFVRIGRSTWFRTARLTREIALPLMKKEMLTRKSLERLT